MPEGYKPDKAVKTERLRALNSYQSNKPENDIYDDLGIEVNKQTIVGGGTDVLKKILV